MSGSSHPPRAEPHPSRLPGPLARWAEQLAVLTPRAAQMLAPMLERLDEVIARQQRRADDADLDGYRGIDRRGHLDRLLLSEWLLAEDFPEEFERRAATGELGYLQVARRRQQTRSAVALLLDTGPDQLGAARLVQLAAVIIAHRRAAAAGESLLVGVLQHPPGRWLTGDLGSVLRQWLISRTLDPPDVTGWVSILTDSLPATTESPDGPRPAGAIWLVGGSALRHQVETACGSGTPATMTVTVRVHSWRPEGVDELAVQVDGETLLLPVPAGPVAVAVLRGHGWSRAEASPAATSEPEAVARLEAPLLTGHTGYLLARERADTVVSIRFWTGHRVWRRHRVPGPVIAAGVIGHRVVVCWLDGATLRATTFGRKLAHFDEIRCPVDTLGVDRSETGALGEVWCYGGDLLLRVAGRLWLIAGSQPIQAWACAAAPSPTLDSPVLVALTAAGLRAGGECPLQIDCNPPTSVFLTSAGSLAFDDGAHWGLVQGRLHHATSVGGIPTVVPLPVQVPDGFQVVGLVDVRSGPNYAEPALVTVAARGVCLLTPPWDTPTIQPLPLPVEGGPVTVHPRLPLVSRAAAGSVYLVNLSEPDRVLRFPAELS